MGCSRVSWRVSEARGSRMIAQFSTGMPRTHGQSVCQEGGGAQTLEGRFCEKNCWWADIGGMDVPGPRGSSGMDGLGHGFFPWISLWVGRRLTADLLCSVLVSCAMSDDADFTRPPNEAWDFFFAQAEDSQNSPPMGLEAPTHPNFFVTAMLATPKQRGPLSFKRDPPCCHGESGDTRPRPPRSAWHRTEHAEKGLIGSIRREMPGSHFRLFGGRSLRSNFVAYNGGYCNQREHFCAGPKDFTSQRPIQRLVHSRAGRSLADVHHHYWPDIFWWGTKRHPKLSLLTVA